MPKMDDELLIMRGGEVAGVVVPFEGYREQLRADLAGAGLEIHDPTEPQLPSADITLDQECTIEDHTPCELKVALGIAEEVAEEAKLPVHGKLSAIIARGYTTTQEATAVIQQWAEEVDASPHCDEDARGWARTITGALTLPQGGAES